MFIFLNSSGLYCCVLSWFKQHRNVLLFPENQSIVYCSKKRKKIWNLDSSVSWIHYSYLFFLSVKVNVYNQFAFLQRIKFVSCKDLGFVRASCSCEVSEFFVWIIFYWNKNSATFPCFPPIWVQLLSFVEHSSKLKMEVYEKLGRFSVQIKL